MFSFVKRILASNAKLSVTNDSVRFEMSTPGWKHSGSDPADHIESFRKGRHVLTANVRRYIRSDGVAATDEMVHDSITTLSRETPTEIFKAGQHWIGHYRSGSPTCEVDNWHLAALSPQGELMVATVIVMFTDENLRTEMRAALSASSLTRI